MNIHEPLPQRHADVFLKECVVLLGILDAIRRAVVCRFVDVPAIVPDVVEFQKRRRPVDRAGLFEEHLSVSVWEQVLTLAWTDVRQLTECVGQVINLIHR